jgi:hypothetical protein
MAFVQQAVLGQEVQNFSVTPLSSAGYDTTFSRANVLGLYLTLSFCLLVQPYGSLLYPKPKTILGRIVFFFWRLNPISAILEVVLLAVALVDGIWIALKAWRTPPEEPLGFWKQLRITATATQLLRSHGRLPEHWRALAQEAQHSAAAQPASPASGLRAPSPGLTDPPGTPEPSRNHDTSTPTLVANNSEPSVGDNLYSDSPVPAGSLNIADR